MRLLEILRVKMLNKKSNLRIREIKNVMLKMRFQSSTNQNKINQIETNDKYNEEIYKDDADSIIQSTEDSKEQDDNYKDTQVNTGATDLQKKGNDSKGRKKSGDDFRANKSSEIVYEKTSKL